MKSILKILLTASLCVFITVMLFSCKKKMTTDCGNGGIMNGGTCLCQPGFEGSDCGTISRTKFLGNWTQSDAGSITTSAQFPVSVASADAISEVSIVNFNNTFRQKVNADITNKDSLIIPTQILDGKTVAGFGFYHGNNDIEVHYTVTDSATGAVQTVDAIW